MSLNARFSPYDPRLYNVNRDVAHNFREVMAEVVRRCEEGTWDVLRRLAQEKGITDRELGRACHSLCRFLATQLDEPGESLGAGLARCGFLDCAPEARVIVMAYLGTVTLGIHWAGVREATLDGQGPALTYRQLRWHGRRCSLLMGMPRWRRTLYRWWRRLRRTWKAFWRGEDDRW